MQDHVTHCAGPGVEPSCTSAVTQAAAVRFLTHCTTVGTPPGPPPFLFFFFSFFWLFRAIPTAYGRSQARGQIRVIAASLCHSHSNARSELHLQTTPQLMAMPGSLTHRVRPKIKQATSWFLGRICFCCAMTGTPELKFRLSLYSNAGY